MSTQTRCPASDPASAPCARRARACLLACTSAWIAACGGGGNDVTPPAVATPTPVPSRYVVAQGNFTISSPDKDFTYFVRRPINTTVIGKIDATVDWTYATNKLWMYVTEGDCTADQFATDDCPGPACPCRFSVTSEESGPKPRVLTLASASAGLRTLFVWNLGPQEEACSYQVVLTTPAGAARAGAVREAGAEMVKKRRPRAPND